MAEETVFLDDQGVFVSASRMMYEGQTYAMSGVTSVKSYEKKSSKVGPIILIVIGVLALVSSVQNSVFVGLIFAGAGIAWWVIKKPEYSVLLTSASGEVKAYASNNKDFVQKIVNAVNEAIIHRG